MCILRLRSGSGANSKISGSPRLAVPFVIILAAFSASAQVNSWTKGASGNWEEMFWSLATLPGPGQFVMITNYGWKAVAIGPSTVANAPQSLTVNSVNVTSPMDSFNTLLLDSVGLSTPLTVN